MRNKINAVIAAVSSQKICARDIGSDHELDAIGITQVKQLDLVLALESGVKDLNGLKIEVSDDVWPDWRTVGQVYEFYGVA